jgi:hypothetical protein
MVATVSSQKLSVGTEIWKKLIPGPDPEVKKAPETDTQHFF